MSQKNIKNNIVIYTAIFGGKDDLIEPKYKPKNCDFVCFTDSDFKSKIWKVIKEKPLFEDPVRSAKKYKILPHRYFPEYKYSIWVDGNILIRGDVNKLINKYLDKCNIAVFNHMYTRYQPNVGRKKRLINCITRNYPDRNNCIYKEADKLIKMADMGKHKDDPSIIKNQIEHYKKEGYPKENGLLHGCVVFRKHNEEEVETTMEGWWKEIKVFSRRDQLSFNYVAWKTNLKFIYIKDDAWNNKYFKHQPHKLRKSYVDK